MQSDDEPDLRNAIRRKKYSETVVGKSHDAANDGIASVKNSFSSIFNRVIDTLSRPISKQVRTMADVIKEGDNLNTYIE